MSKTILFVCLHGAAKSVLAAADFRRLAAARGIPIHATSAGTEPDPEIAPAVVRALEDDGAHLDGQRPRRVSRADVAGASRVVAFGCDLSGVAVPGVPVEQWNDIPAVSDGLPAARQAIRARLERLLEEVAKP
jgi:arsenate reductase (thioredoxin)